MCRLLHSPLAVRRLRPSDNRTSNNVATEKDYSSPASTNALNSSPVIG